MSEAITRRIRQLENQNKKFKKLLESTLQITNEDTAKCLQLKLEANDLRKAVSDLENQKKQLEDELKQYLVQDSYRTKVQANVNIQNKLNSVLNDIQRESSNLQQLEISDENLKALISELEKEKEKLLNDINLVKKADKENNDLAQENLKLKQELALLESQCSANLSNVYSGHNLVKKLSSIKNMQQKLEADISVAKQSPHPLEIPVENAVLELKIMGLEKQKEIILKNLRANLLQSANEISILHRNTSDSQLRGLLTELDIHKTILMMNINDIKEMHDYEEKGKSEKDYNESVEDIPNLRSVSSEILENNDATENVTQCADETLLSQRISIKQFLSSDEPDSPTEPKQSSSFPTNSSEILQQITEIRGDEHTSNYSLEIKCDDDFSCHDIESHDLPTVSEEDEVQNEFLAQHEQLKTEISRLEREREELLRQIQTISSQSWEIIENNSRLLNLETQNELHQAFMREESSEEVQKPPLDDATNQLYGNEEQLLAQRIRELEEDNERIRRNLSLMIEETQSDKEDLEVLEEGERLIKDFSGNRVGED